MEHRNNKKNKGTNLTLTFRKRIKIKGCLHEIRFHLGQKIFFSVSGQFLIIIYMIQPKMKLIASVISLLYFDRNEISFRFIKYHVKHYPKWNHMKWICACVYFIKTKMIGFYWMGCFSRTTPSYQRMSIFYSVQVDRENKALSHE